MKTRAIIPVIALLFLAACENNRFETCDGVSITPTAATVRTLAAAEPFVCKEMEELWDVDAAEVVGRFVGGKFTYTGVVHNIDSQCEAIDDSFLNPKPPQEIVIGELVGCKIGVAPRGDECGDTFELTFSVQNGGSITYQYGTPNVEENLHGANLDYLNGEQRLNIIWGVCTYNDGRFHYEVKRSENDIAEIVYEWTPPTK